MTHWLYTAVIRPALCYGVVVWIGAVYKGNTLTILERVQRLGLLSICGTMRCTPMAAMECLLDLPPIDTYLRAMALRAMNRLRRCGQWKDYTGYGVMDMKFISHSELCSGLAKKNSRNEIAHRPQHQVTTYTPLYSRHQIQERVGEEWLPKSLASHVVLHRWLEG